ncbi:hypothetical protein GCM10028807_16210 [Spirosoma daeguense]
MKKVVVFLSYVLFTFSVNTYGQSPYKTSWKKDGLLMVGIAGASFIASDMSDKVTPLNEEEIKSLSRSSVNSFDRGATYNFSPSIDKSSNTVVFSVMAAPIVLSLVDSKVRRDIGKVSLMYLETTLLSTFLPSFGKGGMPRTRPFLYNTDVAMAEKIHPDSRRSFFSGHTTWAFASAVFLSKVFSDYHPESRLKPVIWIGSLGAASAVGYMRYASGAHFPTDILAGAAVGTLIGFGIPAIHKIKSDRLSITPGGSFETPVALQIRYKL